MSFEINVTRKLGESEIRLSLTAGAGLTALFGPSGTGKTSIINMVSGLLKPDSGKIVVAGKTLFDTDAGINLSPEAREAGYVFQERHLFPHLRVKANLLYGARFADPARQVMSLQEATDFLGIGHLLERWPRNLSGGEAQRVAIGRALLSAPRFLLMDEPLASLDMPRRIEIMQVIERIRDELALPILYVSHDRSELDRLATQIVDIGQL